MKHYFIFLSAVTMLALFSGTLCAADARKDTKKEAVKPADKDPLAKFSDEDLIKIDFCFTKFCECISGKDAKTAAAFISDMPRGLAQLDLNKEADKTSFLKFFAGFEGANIVSSQRMAIGGVGEVTYTNKAGKQGTQRMQNVGGRWKLTGL